MITAEFAAKFSSSSVVPVVVHLGGDIRMQFDSVLLHVFAGDVGRVDAIIVLRLGGKSSGTSAGPG